ncbi:MAG: POTRA domain-containing protein [Melioribacteraceae bacterium]
MFYNKILVLFFIINFVLFSQSIEQQKSEEIFYKIDSIKISGNEITEAEIILRELNFSIGQTISQTQLEFNKERIFSLGLFNKVELQVLNENERQILEISVFESWYIYPLPYLNIRDDRLSRASYGVMLLYKNFRGRNETIFGLATFGYDPSYSISYFNPVLISGENLTFGLNFGYVDIQNRNMVSQSLNGKNFEYDYLYTNFSLGYRLNLFHYFSISPSFEYIKVPEKISSLSASNTNTDRTYSLNLRYEYDDRNLKQFSDDGLYTTAIFSKKGFDVNDVNFNIFTLDFREYRKILGELSAKWRGFYRHTFGEKVPFYELSVLGDFEFIRGHKFDKREGNNYLLGSVEMNYPILKAWDFSLKLPYLPQRLTSARIVIYTNIFFDSGTTYNNDEPLKLKTFDSGWGFGFTILFLPYNAFRLEYAFNEFGKGEFLIESGFSF